MVGQSFLGSRSVSWSKKEEKEEHKYPARAILNNIDRLVALVRSDAKKGILCTEMLEETLQHGSSVLGKR